MKLDADNQARAQTLIHTTPDALRRIADRLETQAREWCLPGESVVYSPTHDQLWIYTPTSVERSKFQALT